MDDHNLGYITKLKERKKPKKTQLDSLTLPDRENKQWTTSEGWAYEFQHISQINVKHISSKYIYVSQVKLQQPKCNEAIY